MRALKIAGAAIAAVIVVIALLLVIGIPSSFLTSTIEERVERETGLKLAINGGAKIGLWPSFNVTLNDIALKDPKDRDINNRLTASRIQADMTLASVWAGRPEITELLIVRPVVTVPLLRVREANPPARTASSNAAGGISIEHVSVTGGTLVMSNLRDRVENRIETINADATMGSDRKLTITGNARASGETAEIRDQGEPARAADRAAKHSDRTQIRGPRPAAGTADREGRSAAQRFGCDDQRRQRHTERRRLQWLGLGRCREQAARETRPRLPEIGGRDVAWPRRVGARSPGAMPRSTSTA